MSKLNLLFILSMVFILGACDFHEPAPATATQEPTKTNTPVPSNTPTAIPPTETPIPSPTIPPDIWLDTNAYELTVQHPMSTDQPDWGTANEIIIPADGMVGGVIFTVEEVSGGAWGASISQGVAPKMSIMKSVSGGNNPPGLYCVADFFPGYSPPIVCDILAPGSIQPNWITPYFAGPKTEVGVALGIGGCSPSTCTAFLRVTNIRLIYYAVPE